MNIKEDIKAGLLGFSIGAPAIFLWLFEAKAWVWFIYLIWLVVGFFIAWKMDGPDEIDPIVRKKQHPKKDFVYFNLKETNNEEKTNL